MPETDQEVQWRKRWEGETLDDWHNRLQCANEQAQQKRGPEYQTVISGGRNTKADRILQNLLPGEPIFVLRGKDILSLMALQHYTTLLELYTPHNTEQLEGLSHVMDLFRLWQYQNPDKIKLPD